jgi:hypothetical protein
MYVLAHRYFLFREKNGNTFYFLQCIAFTIVVLPYIIMYIQNKNDASNNSKNIASYYLFLLQIKKAREE